MTIEIFHRHYLQWEEWLYVNEEGELAYRAENDGAAFLTKGSQTHNSVMTIEGALTRFPADADKIGHAIKRWKTANAK
jgi:hypothetical protein